MTRLKRGDTLSISVTVTDDAGDGIALGLTPGSEEIQSQIRTYGGTLVASFSIAAGASTGDYTMTVADTTSFPVGRLFYDVEYIVSSVKKTLPTQEIIVEKDMTTWT